MKGLNAYPSATAFCSKFAIACLTCGRRHVLTFDHDHGGRGRAGEGLVDRGLGLHHGQALGHAVVGGDQTELEVDGRDREGDEDRGRGDDRDDRVPEHGAQDALPDRRARRGRAGAGSARSGTARSRRPRRRRCRDRRSGSRAPSSRWPGTRARKPADLGASRAGSTVSEPMIAVATTRIVARAMPENTPLPARNMPLIAAMTVRPETSTARPEVAAAISIASTLPAPRARSWRSRAM